MRSTDRGASRYVRSCQATYDTQRRGSRAKQDTGDIGCLSKPASGWKRQPCQKRSMGRSRWLTWNHGTPSIGSHRRRFMYHLTTSSMVLCLRRNKSVCTSRWPAPLAREKARSCSNRSTAVAGSRKRQWGERLHRGPHGWTIRELTHVGGANSGSAAAPPA